MALPKSKLYKITQRLYKELRENPELIQVTKVGQNRRGDYDPNTHKIRLDYRDEIISTLIHEYLHKWNPEKPESWVLKQESDILNSLSTRQIKNIIREFAKNVC